MYRFASRAPICDTTSCRNFECYCAGGLKTGSHLAIGSVASSLVDSAFGNGGAEAVQYAPSQQTENSYESNGEENPEE